MASTQAGVQSAAQTSGPASQEGSFALGAGAPINGAALMVIGRAGLGVDAKTGHPSDSLVVGLEWLSFGRAAGFSEMKTGYHLGVYGGGQFGSARSDSRTLLNIEYGRSWVVSYKDSTESRPGQPSPLPFRLTSFEVTPTLGLVGKGDEVASGVRVGIRLGIRLDMYPEWSWGL